MPGRTVSRGYDARHKQKRREAARVVGMGLARCSRCAGAILPDEPWDLDHTDDRVTWAGPAHRSCNRRAGAIKGNRERARFMSEAW